MSLFWGRDYITELAQMDSGFYTVWLFGENGGRFYSEHPSRNTIARMTTASDVGEELASYFSFISTKHTLQGGDLYKIRVLVGRVASFQLTKP